MDLPWSSPPEGYGALDVERWVTEPPKRAGRTPFARDRARVLHSATLRRLAAKTQVLGPNTDDFIRNRLTHTLEVAQVGRELGQAFGCDPDIVDTACLAHDLGHPPFGHNGERALDEITSQIGGFEGNAQTLRLLTRLEAKSFDETRSAGLNLTRASLDAATKYPWRRGFGPPGSGEKFGVYDDDLDVFTWLRAPSPAEGRRCLEAQVMDFSDDVAYSVHDVEDAVVSHRVDLHALADPGARRDVWKVVRDWYVADAADEELDEAYARLREFGYWPDTTYDGGRRALAALKDMTSQLIGRFCIATQTATHEVYGEGVLTRYRADLVVPREEQVEIAVLKGIAAHYVMRSDERMALLTKQRDIVHELVSALRLAVPRGLDPAFQEDFEQANDDAARLRVVVDQVASLTDSSALALHAKLTR
ncbi:deoxyguanosinetriphosphate triphosphohydrolase [Tenggerimyces flavus]|uniref:Deoxyguanosinetriphosphate triphosphohydrolase-like protein n=1 Tax=Tenggerimyces flavus TaxID=1708749 RepID=A0ABV7YFZ3_9ACTN|nr:deoxyguanosinetriphosphate triphosphohydrolase [Tenggerimyces flavus]MBM7789190.1 dGTPase [Tenggerimyces flavus]